MTNRHLSICLPVVVATIAAPAAAETAPTSGVASSMATFAKQQAGANAEAYAAEKRARYLARKRSGKTADCNDCETCAPCEACKECDDPDERSEREGGLP